MKRFIIKTSCLLIFVPLVFLPTQTGNLKWRYKTGDWVGSSPAIGSDGTIYFGSWDSYLYALNPDGNLKWRYKTGDWVRSSPAIGSDGTIYFGSWDSCLYALNPDGNLKWRYKTGDWVRSSPAIGLDGTIYFGSCDNCLYALNPDGNLKWRYKTGGVVFSSPAIGSDGTIYFGSYDSYLYALNPDGNLKWRYKTGNCVFSSPAIGSDGTIYFGSEDGYLYALRGSGILGSTPWPKFRHDLRNTGKLGEITEIAEKLKPERLPPYLEIISLTLKDGNNDGILEALEGGEINLTVKNKGKGNGYNLKVLVSALENYEGLRLEDSEIDYIRINETKNIRIPISADKRIKTQEVRLRIDVKESYFGADADPKVLVFSTKRLEPPDIKIVQTGVDDDELGESMGNSNGKIELGETVELTTILQNLGTGIAENTTVQVLPLREDEVMYLGRDSTISVGSIKSGEWKQTVLPIYVSKRFKQDEFSLRLKITETKLNITKDTTLVFALNKPFQRPSEIVVPTRPVEKESLEILPLPELTADVDLNIPITGMKNENGIAVVIGGADYKPEIPKVDYALRDAKIIKEYLMNMFGYKEENIIFLRNPTKADLEMVFGIKGKPKGQLYNYVKKDESEVFVYYTGHGAPDLKEKNAYFVSCDADPSYIELQGYPLDLFFENLSQIPAKRMTVVIDACFSGAYDKGLIIHRASPVVGVKIEKVEGIKDKGIIMTSAESNEVASWYPEKKHSLFTYFFLKGLRGEADKNGNKEITVGELESYVKENVGYWARRLHNREQNPRFEGEKSLVILRLR